MKVDMYRRRECLNASIVGHITKGLRAVMSTSQEQPRFRRTHSKTKNGCDTCKRRRIKCSEERPYCMNCVKTGRTCHGYHPPKIWLFDANKSTSSDDESTSPVEPSSSRLGIDTSTSNLSSRRASPMPEEPDWSSMPTPTLSFNMDWGVASREHLLSTFLHKYLSSRSTSDPNTPFTSWPGIACKLAGVPRHEFLTTALMSLSLCLHSLEQNDSRLWSDAGIIYQQSLPKLRKAISRLSQGQSEGLRKAVVAASIVGVHIENMLGSAENADRHSEGIATLIVHGGLDVLEDDGLRRLFYDHRAVAIGKNYAIRSASIYCRPEWLHAARRYSTSTSLTPFQQLWTIAGVTLQLIEEIAAEELNLTPTDSLQYFDRLSTLLQQYEQWKEYNELSFLSTSQDDLGAATLEILVTMCQYASYVICLQRTRKELLDKLREALDVSDRYPAIGDSLKEQLTTIVRVAPVSLGETHGMEALPYLQFWVDASWTAAVLLHNGPPAETAFFVNICNTMRAKGFTPLHEPWLESVRGKSSMERRAWSH